MVTTLSNLRPGCGRRCTRPTINDQLILLSFRHWRNNSAPRHGAIHVATCLKGRHVKHALMTLLLAATLGVTTAFVMPAQSAMAAPGCLGDTCYDHLPSEMGCMADQVKLAAIREMLDSALGIYEQIELMYSPACRAVWGTMWINESDPDYYSTVHLYSQKMYGGPEDSGPSTLAVRDTTVATTIVSWNQSIKACIQGKDSTVDPVLEDWYDAVNNPQCTPWH